ncbi:hypothetical protein ACUN7V_07685 [Quadrisphaera oryzae]|uniref:hypothetical protein n=1 Tax=Quadrisphaera TaxID=317661 RepID=UPI001647F1FA|nr:hypothetical protein [Quadrisphaera sp. RL12-1S]
MDIWLLAVLVAWLPVAAALALLVGRSIYNAERHERHPRVVHRPRPGHSAPVVTITSAPRHPRLAHRLHAHSGHHMHDHERHRVAS